MNEWLLQRDIHSLAIYIHEGREGGGERARGGDNIRTGNIGSRCDVEINHLMQCFCYKITRIFSLVWEHDIINHTLYMLWAYVAYAKS